MILVVITTHVPVLSSIVLFSICICKTARNIRLYSCTTVWLSVSIA